MSAHLLLVIINRRDDLGSILGALRKAGAGGATVIETTGMGRTLSGSLPLFGGLRHLEEGLRTHNHTLFTLIRDETILARTQEAILEIMDDFSEEGSGMMLALPVSAAWGGCNDKLEDCGS